MKSLLLRHEVIWVVSFPLQWLLRAKHSSITFGCLSFLWILNSRLRYAVFFTAYSLLPYFTRKMTPLPPFFRQTFSSGMLYTASTLKTDGSVECRTVPGGDAYCFCVPVDKFCCTLGRTLSCTLDWVVWCKLECRLKFERLYGVFISNPCI